MRHEFGRRVLRFLRLLHTTPYAQEPLNKHREVIAESIFLGSDKIFIFTTGSFHLSLEFSDIPDVHNMFH